ncbi:hypothetical protein DSW25_00670 [Sulfitobacter donghicola DSW-25 = KCTC 12864 = JCM 14565]|uniref:Uncharacterized protein n=1 Tax=Sulfitobacter donghicola DSW-25 = KCTC 12864 = JCM 14565 TaxID=1300350 RepID=A0A073INL4_9RHOB|nr:hypothetical protein DSW25_00670 [Sulfitobacter donghicola DSW-25 = KCTC 12864 = JCM 14565]
MLASKNQTLKKREMAKPTQIETGGLWLRRSFSSINAKRLVNLGGMMKTRAKKLMG